jgi:hypothetical protein
MAPIIHPEWLRKKWENKELGYSSLGSTSKLQEENTNLKALLREFEYVPRFWNLKLCPKCGYNSITKSHAKDCPIGRALIND